MNELTLLQAMRGNTRVASDAAVEDGRRKLLHRIGPSLPHHRPAPHRQTATKIGSA